MRKNYFCFIGLAASLLVAGCTPKNEVAEGVDPNALTAFRTSEGKWGYKNGRGKTVIEAKFDNVLPFRNGVARVKVNEKFGFIDESGKALVEPKYSEAGSFGDGLAPVKDGEKFGFIDRSGKMIIEANYDRADNFGDGFATVVLEGKAGYINKDAEFKEGDPPGTEEDAGVLDEEGGETEDGEGGGDN